VKAFLIAVITATCALGLATEATAQATAGDSAAIILETARRLDREGRLEVARELYRFLRRHFRETPAGRAADSLLGLLPRERVALGAAGAGRTGFVLFNTLYGAFLGIAVPAAFEADDPEPYGAGLLLGAPLGFFGSRAFAKRHFRTAGQAGIASFATLWGTWQGLAFQQATDLGSEEVCGEFGCFTNESDTAPWVAMMAGGAVGLATGWALGARREIPSGTSTLVSHAALWGTWFGLSLGRAAGLESDNLFWTMIGAGNAGLLAAIPAAARWRPTSSRLRLITAAGLAGGLAGFGIDLLTSVDEAEAILGIPAAASALGLIIGTVATRNRPDLDSAGDDGGMASGALVDATRGLRLQVPIPQPVLFRTIDAAGGTRRRLGLRLVLLHR
jgi:hypothetical protein